MPTASHILVFGGSNQVGRFLLPALEQSGRNVLALSRELRFSSTNGLHWLQGDLHSEMPAVPTVETIVSLGPLDAFAAWLARTTLPQLRRIVALSSMSAVSKFHSPDREERELAQRLVDGEQRLIEICAQRGQAWTVFRPTLIYGAGLDRSLTPVARLASRYRILPIPLRAVGLRQPLHAEDLAQACLAVLANPATFNRSYPLGGGERLRFDAMLWRLRASLAQWVLPLPMPHSLLRLGLRISGRAGVLAALTRVACDLIADNGDAQRDFNFAPRSFFPDPACWGM